LALALILGNAAPACQLGITISSLGLGWIGEPALASLIEPFLVGVLGSYGLAGAHIIAITIAFSIITILHIVLGELAPKSLALQRSEGTALWVVRPLGWFRVLLWPAIVSLNGLGNFVLRLFGLRPGTAEETLHSPEELKLLIAASRGRRTRRGAPERVWVTRVAPFVRSSSRAAATAFITAGRPL
jgi:putative hemolysin